MHQMRNHWCAKLFIRPGTSSLLTSKVTHRQLLDLGACVALYEYDTTRHDPCGCTLTSPTKRLCYRLRRLRQTCRSWSQTPGPGNGITCVLSVFKTRDGRSKLGLRGTLWLEPSTVGVATYRSLSHIKLDPLLVVHLTLCSAVTEPVRVGGS